MYKIYWINRAFAQEFWEAKAVVTIWQSYNITGAKEILGDLRREGERFQKRHGGVVESFIIKELEFRTKNALRHMKNALKTHTASSDKLREKRNIFGTILHGIADVATGR